MELEGFKSAWQERSLGARSLSSPAHLSSSVRFLRASAIKDLQRSDEVSRLVFSLLFAVLAVGVSAVIMSPGWARVAAWLFAAALLADGLAGVALLARRFRAPATASLVDFIRREHQQARTRLQLERYSRRLTFALAAVALGLLLLAPHPVNPRENALDALTRMALVTAFLLFAWRRAKSRSAEVCRELESYLKDLES